MNIKNIEEDEFDVSKITQHLKKNLKMILFITLLLTIVSGIYSYFLPSSYSSSVSISFSNKEAYKIISNESQPSKDKVSELEKIKFTIKTRNFIGSAIKDLNLSEQFFIEKNFKKNETYGFDNLKVTVDIYGNSFIDSENKSLYGTYFQIEPIDNNRYRLSINSLDYVKEHYYGRVVKEEFFSFHILKKGNLKHKKYFIKISNKEQIVTNILENLNISLLAGNVLKITYTDTLSKRTKKLVNIIAKEFMLYSLKKKTDVFSKTIVLLSIQIDEVKENLRRASNALKNYERETDAFMPLESSKIMMKTIHRKEEELKKLQFQNVEVKSFKKALIQNQLNTVSLLNSGINTDSIQILIELFRSDNLLLNEIKLQFYNIEKSITDNLQLISLINEYNSKKKLLVNLKFNFTAGHPQVHQVENDITTLEDDIKSYIETHISKLTKNIKLTKNKILNNIDMTKSSLNRKINELIIDIRKEKIKLQALPEKDLIRKGLKRNFTLSENLYINLLEKKMEFEVLRASTTADTYIIEDAIEGQLVAKNNKKLILYIGFIIGLIVGVFFTILRVLFDSKIRDVSIIERLTEVPIYGTLPKKSNIGIFKEALRGIRTNLFFVLPKDKKCVTLLISSTVASEGKTTIVATLGEIISSTDKRVLLIDLDLRKPRLYEELKKSNKIGVTNYLREDLTLDNLIQPINEQLDFIAAGAVPSNPSELFLSDKFNVLMNELMKKYDYILFDTSPIITVIDALLILKYTDILLFVLNAESSKKTYLEDFNRLVKDKSIKYSGIILNKVKLTKDHDYGYGYGKG